MKVQHNLPNSILQGEGSDLMDRLCSHIYTVGPNKLLERLELLGFIDKDMAAIAWIGFFVMHALAKNKTATLSVEFTAEEEQKIKQAQDIIAQKANRFNN